MKICSDCKEEKPYTEFKKGSRYKDGYRGQCKLCLRKKRKAYDEINQKTVSETKKRWNLENKEHRQHQARQYYLENQERLLQKAKLYRLANPNIRKQQKAKFAIAQPQYFKNYIKNRKQVDCLFKLIINTRSLLNTSFKRYKYRKNSKTATILGCSFEFLQKHLVNSALTNYGFYLYDELYHIDHIIPLSSASTEEEILELNHYSNLQLLYPKDNLTKGDKLNWTIG